MPDKEKKKSFGYATSRAAIGLFLILFGVSLGLSPLSDLAYVGYPFILGFGTIGLFIIAFGIVFIGFRLLLNGPIKKVGFRIAGSLVLLFGAMWWLTSAASTAGVVDVADLPGAISNAIQTDKLALLSAPFNVGYLGAALLNAFRSSNNGWLNFLFSGILVGLALLILFFPLIVMLVRHMRVNARIRAAKVKEEQKAAQEEADSPFSSLEFDPDSQGPSLQFKPEEPVKTVTSTYPQYNFSLASGSTLPKRREIHQESRKQEVEDTSILPPTAPSPLPSPEPSSYRSSPLHTRALQEATFDFGEGEEAYSPIIEEPVFGEEESKEERTSLAESAKKMDILLESEQEEYVPPRNDPISIIDGGEGIIAADTLDISSIAPSLPPKEEPKPKVEPIFQPEEVETKKEPIFQPEPKQTSLFDPEPVIEEEPDYPPITGEPGETVEEQSLFEVPDAPDEEEEEPAFTLETKEEPVQPATIAPQPKPVEVPKEPSLTDIPEDPLPPYTFPDESLLADPSPNGVSKEDQMAECAQKAERIDAVFNEFHVGAHVSDILIGPSITRYSIAADSGVSVATIARVIPDLEVRLGGLPIRFAERVPGYDCSAIELANSSRRIVSYKELYVSLPKRKPVGPSTEIPFGLDISGKLLAARLAKFPHMLVAGTSGSGKSIFAHSILMTLIMRNRPEDLKLVLIDPKRGVEMARYKDLPHLLCPIVKEAIPAKNALKKLVDLMNIRYRMLEEVGATSLEEYNNDYAYPEHKKRMSLIVCFIDEFSDLVTECKEVSEYVLTLAAKARSCGIHLIVATQRPDVKVITGTIKANLACRVALTVASSQDSMTILGRGGAESLYGLGDMLIDCAEITTRDFLRAQGCLTKLPEGKRVCDFIRAQLPPNYDPDFLDLEDKEDSFGPEVRDGGYAPIGPTPAEIRANAKALADDEKYEYIRSVVMTREKCSISLIQREFEVGFTRAGKIFLRLQKEGVISQPIDPNSSKGCRVLIHSQEELEEALKRLGDSGDGQLPS